MTQFQCSFFEQLNRSLDGFNCQQTTVQHTVIILSFAFDFGFVFCQDFVEILFFAFVFLLFFQNCVTNNAHVSLL